MTEVFVERRTPDGRGIPFTRDQLALADIWMADARREGAAEAAARLMGMAAYSYFKFTSASEAELAHLCSVLYNVLPDALAAEQDAENEDLAEDPGE